MIKLTDLIGSKRTYPDPRSLYDLTDGRYQDQVYAKPEESRYPLLGNKAPDPNPFVRR